MKKFILPAVLLYCLACSEDGPNPVNVDNTTVHLAGIILTAGGVQVPSYWKNGIYNNLMNDTTMSAGIHSLIINDSLVSISGVLLNSISTFDDEGVTWQNGLQSRIEGVSGKYVLSTFESNNLISVWEDSCLGFVFTKDGSVQPVVDTASFFPVGLAVAGNSVYLAGNAKGYYGGGFLWSNMFAQYWKDGQLIFREREHSVVSNIFIHENDIYLSGYLHRKDSSTHEGYNIACYWKNGQLVELEKRSSAGSRATSIFVTDSGVFVLGDLNFKPVYWKNGVVTHVTYLQTASATTIFVKGSDVYVGGSIDGHPAYWKNEVKQNISHQNKHGEIKFIVVGPN
ncbi:MAG: hypothetical protein J0L67_13550 [Cytophagales bacterium]|nr:hypothetical protein [Cytophagales bacterium]